MFEWGDQKGQKCTKVEGTAPNFVFWAHVVVIIREECGVIEVSKLIICNIE